MTEGTWGGLAEVAALEHEAALLETPCGAGKLAWRRWGRGPTLILLHGGFGSWKHWCRNIRDLTRHFTVYAVDLPGLGDSDVAPEPHTGEALAAIIADGIDRLLGSDARYVIAAFSLGGAISAPLIVEMGERVVHAVLVGPGGLGKHWKNAVAGQRRRNSSMSEKELRDVVRENLGFTMIADRDKIDEDTVSIQMGLLNQKRRLLGLPISESSIVVDALPRICGRTTIVWGDHDPYLHPDLETAIASMKADCPGLDARVIPNAGHWTCYEAPEAINAEIRSKSGY